MKIKFADSEHQKFFFTMKEKSHIWDEYHQALFYVLGICADCWENISFLFDFNEDCIKISGLQGGWHTSGSKAVCRLAFNLWNDYSEEEDAASFTPSNLFCCEYAPFMWQGIKLRYPEYCTEERFQIKDKNGHVLKENLSSPLIAESYAQIYEREYNSSCKIETMPDIISDI